MKAGTVKPGTFVEVVANDDNEDYYSIGDRGIVMEVDHELDLFVDFEANDDCIWNPDAHDLKDAHWYIRPTRVKVIE